MGSGPTPATRELQLMLRLFLLLSSSRQKYAGTSTARISAKIIYRHFIRLMRHTGRTPLRLRKARQTKARQNRQAFRHDKTRGKALRHIVSIKRKQLSFRFPMTPSDSRILTHKYLRAKNCQKPSASINAYVSTQYTNSRRNVQ